MTQPQESPKVFAPKLWPTLIALVMLGILLSLGTWQVRRYGETSGRVAQYRRQHDERPPVTSLGEGQGVANRLEELHFRRAALRGKLDLEHLHLLTARYKFGQRGWGVLAPIQVASGPHARILVNLGWVPVDKLADFRKKLASEPPDLFRGRLRAVGDAPPNQQPLGTHEGLATWMVADPKAISAKVPDLDPDLLLDVGEQAVGQPVNPEAWPLDGYEYPIHPLPTKHIEYASTWYLLAVTLVAVWIALSRRPKSQPTS